MEIVFENLRSFMEWLFGAYTPVTYQSASGFDIIPDGLAGVDMSYVASVLLFSIVLYSLFRLLGGIFK